MLPCSSCHIFTNRSTTSSQTKALHINLSSTSHLTNTIWTPLPEHQWTPRRELLKTAATAVPYVPTLDYPHIQRTNLLTSLSQSTVRRRPLQQNHRDEAQPDKRQRSCPQSELGGADCPSRRGCFRRYVEQVSTCPSAFGGAVRRVVAD